MDTLSYMVQALFNTAVVVAVALLLPGVINRTRAILAGRKGVTMYQHLNNVHLLLRKGAVYSSTTTFLFRAVPAVYLGATLTALLFVPVGNLRPLLSFEGDVVMFAYLFALGRLAIVLAAMDTGSSFEGMGASREALYGALVEPAMFLVFATLALITGYTSFADIFGLCRGVESQMIVVLLLVCYVVVRVITVEAGRIPVDDPRTHLELTMIHEVMVLDYCGIDLGMIQIAGWLKTAAFAVIAADVMAYALWYNIALVLLAALGVGVFIGIVESLQARNKLSRNTTYILTIVALAMVVFFVAYLLQHDIDIQ